jgi:hypothetical protein
VAPGKSLARVEREGETSMEAMLNLVAMQNSGGSGGGIGGVIAMIIWLAIIIGFIAGLWKVFVKAGQPGWAAIIPIFNLYIMLKITGRPVWWLVLFIIPIVSLVVAIITAVDLAKAFGKGTGFGIGLAFLGFIFIPILGFGDAQYRGPVAA